MSLEIELLTKSVQRYLADHWPIERAAQANQSVEERRRIWKGLVDIGIPQLGSAESGGLTAALPVVRELGAAHCAAPVPELIALNTVARGTDWLKLIQSGDIVPAFAPASAFGTAALGTVRFDAGMLRGQVGLVDAIGASWLAIIADRTGPCLVGVDLAQQLGIRLTQQTAFLEGGLSRIEFEGARGFALDLSHQEARNLSLLWRLLLATRATGALQRAQSLVVEHVKQRRQFGMAIGSFQAIQHKLADIQIALDSAALTQEIAARSFDAGDPRWCFEALAAIAAADPALRKSMLEVHHAFGAMGYSEEHEVPRHFRRVHLDLARTAGPEARRELCVLTEANPQAQLPESDLGEEAEAFRVQVRAWLQKHWTDADRAAESRLPLSERGTNREFSRALGETGWIAVAWPKEQGGQGRSRLEQLALIQEMTSAMAPTTGHIAAASLIAPALLAFGSPEQKTEFLPRIARGELTICLGYSEPEAGSDLASLRTRAVRDGNDWIITGQKMWGTTTDKADYVWLAARTDPDAAKHAGISVFLVPMNLPGITVRPGMALYGKTFSTQFYDEVRVPASALVGVVNDGWKVITGALADERILIGTAITQVADALSGVLRLLRDEGRLDALARDRIGALIAEVSVARTLLMRSVLLTEQGRPAPVEAAMTKICTGEVMERFAEAAIDLVGPRSILSQGSPDALLNGELDRLLRTGPMQVIGGGANEIQRTLIAQRGLGLPR